MDGLQKKPGAGEQDGKGSLLIKKPVKHGRATAKPAVGGRGRGAGAAGGNIPGPTGVVKPEAGEGPKDKAAQRGSQGLGRALMSKAARATARASMVADKQRQRQEGALLAASLADKGSAAAAAAAAAAADDAFAGTFSKELPVMMYGFGDDEEPLQETVDVVEAALLQYLGSVVSRASAVAASCLKARMDEKDVLFVVRKDPAKFARIKELLVMQQVIKEARALQKNDLKLGTLEEAPAADKEAG